MNDYVKMLERHQEELAQFPIVYAFGQEQFEKAMQKLGLEASDTEEVCSIFGAGDIIRKSDAPKFLDLLKKHHSELQKAIEADTTGDGFVFEMFSAELENHEYGYTEDPTDALSALGLTLEQVINEPKMLHGFKKACKSQNV